MTKTCISEKSPSLLLLNLFQEHKSCNSTRFPPSLNADSWTSLLIGNMVTSVLGHHITHLQIVLGVLMHRKKIIRHMYDYNVTCSYDELRRYKKSSAVARSMLATGRSPVATSMFDDKGQMRTAQKSHLKTELAVRKSYRGVKKDAYFLDGCAILWVAAWPGASNAVIQDYLNAFRAHVRRYQETAYVLLFEHYIADPAMS